jgi:hypothetical protein
MLKPLAFRILDDLPDGLIGGSKQRLHDQDVQA